MSDSHDTYAIARSTTDDRYTVWRFEKSNPALFVQQAAQGSFPRANGLVAVGGYLLSTAPWNNEYDYPQLDFNLFTFDPDSPDPLNAAPVQAGSWDVQDKFWLTGYTYQNGPGGDPVTDVQLIGITGYVLSFLPTDGRGSFCLWNFDAYSTYPSGQQDPIEDPIYDANAFPQIGLGHQLLPIRNYVIDWVPADGTVAIYSFDPQAANPLSLPTLWQGSVPEGYDSLLVVGEHLLAYASASGSYTLYDFRPDDPFHGDATPGADPLPSALLSNTSLSTVQTLAPAPKPDKTYEPGSMDFMRQKIEHVVYFVLESRSFDNVVGWLHDEEDPSEIHWVNANPPFRGAHQRHFNNYDGGTEEYHQDRYEKGALSTDYDLTWPHYDPFHGTSDTILQQWSKGYASYQQQEPADMGGFVTNNGIRGVMGGYSPEQLPVLNGLAHHFAVSDAWFCSEAGGTTTNRATLTTGSALNLTLDYEGGQAYTYFPNTPHRQSLWKVLSNHGLTDWKIYYSVLWEDYPYTYHLWLRGQVPSVDKEWPAYIQPIESFLHAAHEGELPKFSFLEPVWISGEMSTSFHPGTNVIPGEVALRKVYRHLKNSPQWEKTALVISFSKGGGMYDHMPARRMKKAWPHDEQDGYRFDVTGTRVPTIVVSPWVKPKTVFRSGDEKHPFDHTSLAATLLTWLGVPKARWGMGDRIEMAPTFETVFTKHKARTHAPSFRRSWDGTYPQGAEVPVAGNPTTDGTWRPPAPTADNPDPDHWTHPANWTQPEQLTADGPNPAIAPAVVPTGTASFGEATSTTIRFMQGSASSIEEIVFLDGAPAYAFELTQFEPETPTLSINGKGVVNQSGNPQSFTVAATSTRDSQAQLAFNNHASAGDDTISYAALPASDNARTGGIIAFNQQATAGSALFTVRTGAKHPASDSTVGAEVQFNHDTSAGTATFTVYGSTGTYSDTFGNVVFHNRATAHQAQFTNIGGTTGDGGNTQFYEQTTAHQATFHNRGAQAPGANGGDVAFDGTARAGHATFHNHASEAGPTTTSKPGRGGVVSFNNNWPPMALDSVGASADHATIYNYGAKGANPGTGGHTEFQAAYGRGTAGNARIHNHGAEQSKHAGAGYTSFSMYSSASQRWQPTAGSAHITNHPSKGADAQPGYTVFFTSGIDDDIEGPTAGQARIENLGAAVADANGGKTTFEDTSTAGEATLVATAGTNGGRPGRILFKGRSTGGSATIELAGGTLDLSEHTRRDLSLSSLRATDGSKVKIRVGDELSTLKPGKLDLSGTLHFEFVEGTNLTQVTRYDLIEVPGLKLSDKDKFCGTQVGELYPHFHILLPDKLRVSFTKVKAGSQVCGDD